MWKRVCSEAVSLGLTLHPPSATMSTEAATLTPSSPSSTLHPLPQPPSPTLNLPTQTYHSSLLPRSIPTPALLDSVAGGAHYSGVESLHLRRRSYRGQQSQVQRGEPNSPRRQSIVPAGPNLLHLAIMDDLKDVRGSSLQSRGLLSRSYSFSGDGVDV